MSWLFRGSASSGRAPLLANPKWIAVCDGFAGAPAHGSIHYRMGGSSSRGSARHPTRPHGQ